MRARPCRLLPQAEVGSGPGPLSAWSHRLYQRRLICCLVVQAEVASGLLLNPAWAALEHELAQAVQQAIHGYWRHWRESHQDEEMWSPEVQVTPPMLFLQ